MCSLGLEGCGFHGVVFCVDMARSSFSRAGMQPVSDHVSHHFNIKAP